MTALEHLQCLVAGNLPNGIVIETHIRRGAFRVVIPKVEADIQVSREIHETIKKEPPADHSWVVAWEDALTKVIRLVEDAKKILTELERCDKVVA